MQKTNLLSSNCEDLHFSTDGAKSGGRWPSRNGATQHCSRAASLSVLFYEYHIVPVSKPLSPSWDLVMVLDAILVSPFELLHKIELKIVSSEMAALFGYCKTC